MTVLNTLDEVSGFASGIAFGLNPEGSLAENENGVAFSSTVLMVAPNVGKTGAFFCGEAVSVVEVV